MTQSSKLTGINRNIVNRYYRIFREKICSYQGSISRGFQGEIELDESYSIRGYVKSRGTVCTDRWRAYNGVVLTDTNTTRLTIENFLSFAKGRLQRFNDILK